MRNRNGCCQRPGHEGEPYSCLAGSLPSVMSGSGSVVVVAESPSAEAPDVIYVGGGITGLGAVAVNCKKYSTPTAGSTNIGSAVKPERTPPVQSARVSRRSRAS